MSEEEKKAIEWFKKDLMFWLIEGKDYVIIDNGEIPKMKSLLNLIDNQQKEIEEKTTIIMAGAEKVKQLEKEIEKLNFENHMLKKWNEQLDQNCISKDKIKEKLKELEEQFKKYENEGLSGFVRKIDKGTRIEVLKELLEENIKEENS